MALHRVGEFILGLACLTKVSIAAKTDDNTVTEMLHGNEKAFVVLYDLICEIGVQENEDRETLDGPSFLLLLLWHEVFHVPSAEFLQ